MKLVILIGNAAVGKMTTGQALMDITELRLFHNHMTIEPVIKIFGYFNGEVISQWRDIVFDAYAKSDAYGLIFTYMWAFDQPSDHDYIQKLHDKFKNHGADVYFVELVTTQQERLVRNESEFRLLEKASKRDLEASKQRLLDADQKYRLESYEGEITYPNYIKIDNTNLSSEKVAQIIKSTFSL